jgi:hypothetical protein
MNDMLTDDDDNDPLAEIKRLDRFYDGEEEGDRPLEILRERGVDLPDDSSLDDEALHQRLELLIDEMANIGMLLDSTDHLSDRELYRYLLTDALLEETVLPSSSAGAWHISPIGGCSNEDTQIYLRYYADDEDREHWRGDSGDPLPPREKLPFDRDRHLPTQSRARTGPQTRQ